jgi:hypothetical protein
MSAAFRRPGVQIAVGTGSGRTAIVTLQKAGLVDNHLDDRRKD